jgi:hypothetical protein
MLEGFLGRIITKGRAEGVPNHIEETPKQIGVNFVDPSTVDLETKEILSSIEKEGTNVNFKESMGTWTFRVGEGNFFSKDYANCTGVVVVGIDKKTGKPLTLMTHQNTEELEEFGKGVKERFMKELGSFLILMKKQAKKGSIDCVRFGGFDGGYGPDPEYEKSINLASEVVEQELGLKLRVVAEPNMKGKTDAYFDSKNRILYIVRAPQNH